MPRRLYLACLKFLALCFRHVFIPRVIKTQLKIFFRYLLYGAQKYHFRVVTPSEAFLNWPKNKIRAEANDVSKWLELASKIDGRKLNRFLSSILTGVDKIYSQNSLYFESPLFLRKFNEDLNEKFRSRFHTILPSASSKTATRNKQIELLPGLSATRYSPAESRTTDVLMPIISQLYDDGRLWKIAQAIAATGKKVTVIAPRIWKEQVFDARIPIIPNVETILIESDGAEFEADGVYWAPFLEQLLRFRPKIIYCHDVHPLLSSILAARLCGARLIVDLHELRSEGVEYDAKAGSWRPIGKVSQRRLEKIERLAFLYADEVISVSDGVIDILKNKYGDRDVLKIYNTPSMNFNEYLGRPVRKLAKVKNDEFLIIYQGGLGDLRMLDIPILGMKYLDRCKLVIRGNGATGVVGEKLRELVAKEHLISKVCFLEGVDKDEVVNSLNGADVGLCTLSNMCLSFRNSLNNKNFEYMFAGIPQVMADYPEMAKFNSKHKIGLVFDPTCPRSFAKAIKYLQENPDQLERFRNNSVKARTRREFIKSADNVAKLVARMVR